MTEIAEQQPPPSDITQMLHQAVAGNDAARHKLFAVVYRELRVLARAKLSRESPMTLLDPTSLVHESWFRLSGNLATDAANRRAFFGYASKVMRSVIVDYVRERNAEKRGSGAHPVTLITELAGVSIDDTNVLAIHQALEKLKLIDERCHDVVELRYFAGFTLDECASHLGVAPTTVGRDWEKARLFLAHELAE